MLHISDHILNYTQFEIVLLVWKLTYPLMKFIYQFSDSSNVSRRLQQQVGAKGGANFFAGFHISRFVFQFSGKQQRDSQWSFVMISRSDRLWEWFLLGNTLKMGAVFFFNGSKKWRSLSHFNGSILIQIDATFHAETVGEVISVGDKNWFSFAVKSVMLKRVESCENEKESCFFYTKI